MAVLKRKWHTQRTKELPQTLPLAHPTRQENLHVRAVVYLMSIREYFAELSSRTRKCITAQHALRIPTFLTLLIVTHVNTACLPNERVLSRMVAATLLKKIERCNALCVHKRFINANASWSLAQFLRSPVPMPCFRLFERCGTREHRDRGQPRSRRD